MSWKLSTTLDAGFCVGALKEALDTGRRHEIFNTDQGSQFTSEAFLKVLTLVGVLISMDLSACGSAHGPCGAGSHAQAGGQGRAFDNIMVERLWRSVKYEAVYLEGYETVPDARRGLARCFDFYNHERSHSSLGKRTPGSVYGLETRLDTGWKQSKIGSYECGR